MDEKCKLDEPIFIKIPKGTRLNMRTIQGTLLEIEEAIRDCSAVTIPRKDVAKLFNVTIPTIRNWTRDGTLKEVRISKGSYMTKDSVLDLLRQIREASL